MPRGIANNNPGNIRLGQKWQGASDKQTDSAFIQFTDAIWGLRALAKILLTYQSAHGLKTIEQIIHRWAPPNENDTESYIRSVSGSIAVPPDIPIDLSASPLLLKEFVQAIIKHENGMQPYTDDEVMKAIRLALE